MGEDHEVLIKSKQELEATLTGKDNKKERTAVAKEIKALRDDPKYVDAQKIAKGLTPPKGNFMVVKKPMVEQIPAAAAEPAGISKEERQELEDLKKKHYRKKNRIESGRKV